MTKRAKTLQLIKIPRLAQYMRIADCGVPQQMGRRNLAMTGRLNSADKHSTTHNHPHSTSIELILCERRCKRLRTGQ